ncbi:MAG: YraN family protein [Candidatus Gracilibacteria bacterium]
MKNTQNIGRMGENIAVQHLINQKFDIIARNFYCKYGEIDIIAEKNNTIYFFEVKTRYENSMNHPAESITYQKQQHLIKSALTFLDRQPGFRRATPRCAAQTKSWRISLIGILLPSRFTPASLETSEIEIIDIY